MQNIKTADWSEEVAPFWGAVIKSAVSADGIKGLFKAGWTTIKVHLSPDLVSSTSQFHNANATEGRVLAFDCILMHTLVVLQCPKMLLEASLRHFWVYAGINRACRKGYGQMLWSKPGSTFTVDSRHLACHIPSEPCIALQLSLRVISLQGALVMPLMSTGYKMGLIKFVLITAEKP